MVARPLDMFMYTASRRITEPRHRGGANDEDLFVFVKETCHGMLNRLSFSPLDICEPIAIPSPRARPGDVLLTTNDLHIQTARRSNSGDVAPITLSQIPVRGIG